MALPVDPRIEAMLVGARGTVSGGNARRRQSALMAAMGLTTSGLLERADASVAARAGAGFAEAPELENETWDANGRFEGRAFRDSIGGINASAAARGSGFSSATRNAVMGQRRALYDQINSIRRGLAGDQSESVQAQSDTLGPLGRGIADIRFEQARDAAAAPPVLSGGEGTAAGGGGAPGGGGGGGTPGMGPVGFRGMGWRLAAGPGTGGGAPAGGQRTPKKSYQSFLGGRGSTEALSKIWDRDYNYGQRWGGT